VRKSRAPTAVSHPTCSVQYCHPHKLATWIIKVVSSAAKIKLLGLSKSQVSVQFSKTAVCVIICAVRNLKEELKSE